MIGIRKQYLQMRNIKDIEWSVDGWPNLGWDSQDEFLKMTILHPVSISYPPSVTYRRQFLKWVIQQLEEAGREIHDDMYTQFANLMAENDESEYCYKTYTMPSGKLVTLQESGSLVSKGTTGLRTWQAALNLAEWALSNKAIFSKKCVLELGSGLGLTGLAVMTECLPQAYVLSDCHSEVLRLLEHNLQLNAEQAALRSGEQQHESHPAVPPAPIPSTGMCARCGRNHENFTTATCAVSNHGTSHPFGACTVSRTEGEQMLNNSHLTGTSSHEKIQSMHSDSQDGLPGMDVGFVDRLFGCGTSVVHLDWETVTVDQLGAQFAQVDVILAAVFCGMGADVVYDPSIIPALVKVLAALLQADDGTKSRRRAYVASTVRNDATQQLFQTALREAGILITQQQNPENQCFYYDRSVAIEILELCCPQL